MTKVTFKERRFSSAFVEECKAQDQAPEADCDRAPQIEGVLACPESRRPKKKKARGMTPHFVHMDTAAYFSTEEPKVKRVSQHHLSKLNTNNAHIQDGQLIEKPKKVTGFENLRDLIGKN
jgi:hypothetical protein